MYLYKTRRRRRWCGDIGSVPSSKCSHAIRV